MNLYLKKIKKSVIVLVIFQLLYPACIFSATLNHEKINNLNFKENYFNLDIESFNKFYDEPKKIENEVENELKEAQTHILKAITFLNKENGQQSEKELIKAKQLLNLLLKKEKNIHALNGLATIALLQKDNGTALSLVEQSLSENNIDNDKALRIKAKIFSNTGNIEKAEQIYLLILLKNNKDISIYLELANLAIKKNSKEKAERYLLKAYSNAEGGFKQILYVASLIGKWYTQNKEFDKLMSFSEVFLNRYSEQVESKYFMVGAQLSSGKKLEAEKTLYEIINADKTEITHRLLLVGLLTKQGDRKKDILKLLDEIIIVNPKQPKALAIKINYLIKVKDYFLAEKNVKEFDQSFPGSVITKELMGNVYLAKKDFINALEQYQQAYQKKQNQKLLFKIVGVMKQSGSYDKATRLLETELNKNDQNITILYHLAEIYQKQRSNIKAVEYYKKVVSLDPKNIFALNNLAGIYAEQKNPEAVEIAKKAYQLAPNIPSIADTYAYILVQQGDSRKATPILEKAMKQAPNAKEIQFHLAKAYSQSKLTIKAKQLLKKILNDSKPFKDKNSARKLLKKLM